MTRSRTLTVLLPLAIIVAAVVLTAAMIALKKAPPKSPAKDEGVLVEVIRAERRDLGLTLSAAGTVTACRQVSIEPQVGGRVVKLGAHFAAGSFFRHGDLLLQIEPTDYRLAVDQAAAALARAEVDLATTESQAQIARSEWEALQLDSDRQPNPLVLYEPQLKNARAGVASAQAALKQAQLNLKRTCITAPFSGRIRSEQIDIGQVVRAGGSVATLSGSDEVEVIVSLPFDDLRWLQVPGPNGGSGSAAVVTLPGNASGRSWNGEVDRSLGEVDARGRMLQVAVRVADPYLLREKSAAPPYLEVGMFVDVQFTGPQLKQVIELPRRALRDNDRVWLMDPDGKLRIRPVEVLRRQRESVLIGSGLEAGETVVLTTLNAAADGLRLRTAEAAQ